MDQEDTDALLRSGNNELHALVFQVAGQQFGVNVAKLDELIMPPRTRTWPGQHPSILGAFNLRSENIALVDLGSYICPGTDLSEKGSTAIVTSFNKSKIGFLVDSVDQILRVDWGMVGPPAGSTGPSGVITGIMKYDEKLIPILDFESIHDDIAGVDRIEKLQIDVAGLEQRSEISVLFVEDSQYMSAVISNLLEKAGFLKVESFSTGEDAYNSMRARSADNRPDVVISDIEMPRMDGLTMTRKLKELPIYRNTPFILFSSIITKEQMHKGEKAGADAQLNKGDVDQLLPLMDSLLFGGAEQESDVKPDAENARAA